MSLDIRIKVNDERKQKLQEIDGIVDANKSKVIQRLIDNAIDEFHGKLFKPGDCCKTMEPVGDDERNA